MIDIKLKQAHQKEAMLGTARGLVYHKISQLLLNPIPLEWVFPLFEAWFLL